MDTQLKQLMLDGQYRDKIVLPNMNFTNTQSKMQIPKQFNVQR